MAFVVCDFKYVEAKTKRGVTVSTCGICVHLAWNVVYMLPVHVLNKYFLLLPNVLQPILCWFTLRVV